MQTPPPPSPASATLDQWPHALTPEPLPHASPLFLCSIPAGFPSPATDYIEGGLDLNEYLVRHKAASFMFRVQGHSMQGAGIVDGDKVVVDRSIEPQHNQIVIAVVDGEYTIKRLYRKNGSVELHSENPAFKPICFKDGCQLEIWGVVVGVVRRYAC
ncbi:MAG: response UmuD protein Serine peptidase family [Polaromonas sp.]|jgi:DNA polymerase V|nr:response UmuD protein Serine peptidase family [Polaromonas sp.]